MEKMFIICKVGQDLLHSVFVGKCSIDLNCIASRIFMFLNMLKPAPSTLCLAISCGYDFISKANSVSVSPCSPLAIYPKMAFKIFPLSLAYT